jgi:hypothetical protein
VGYVARLRAGVDGSRVGADFLPFGWVYRTNLYAVLSVVVSVGPFVLAVLAGARALHYTGFFVGAALLAGCIRRATPCASDMAPVGRARPSRRRTGRRVAPEVIARAVTA